MEVFLGCENERIAIISGLEAFLCYSSEGLCASTYGLKERMLHWSHLSTKGMSPTLYRNWDMMKWDQSFMKILGVLDWTGLDWTVSGEQVDHFF